MAILRLKSATIVVILLMIMSVTVVGQDGQNIILDFTLYEGNPVLTRSEFTEWDGGVIFPECIRYHDGLFHMLYSGREDPFDPYNIGYATSTDGLNWEKYADNPIIYGNETEYEQGILGGPCYFEDDEWVMYAHPYLQQGYRPSSLVIRMTAPEITGPWTVDETMLDLRDDPSIVGLSADVILQVDGQYRMYYCVLPTDRFVNSAGLRMATSEDGINFSPYEDPTLPHNNLFKPTDGGIFGLDILPVDDGWEMFYAFTTVVDNEQSEWGIGYATSEDGLSWIPLSEEPFLLDIEIWFPHVVVVDDVYYVYYLTHHGFENLQQISVAIGTITRGE